MEDIDNGMKKFLFVWNVINEHDQGHLQAARYMQLVCLAATVVSLTRRQHVPRIYYFVERLNFRVHHRISKDIFDEILDLVKSDLMPELKRGREAIQPDKKLNILVLYGKHGISS